MKSITLRAASYSIGFGGILLLILTAGYTFQMPWATATWPWPDSRLSYVFVASILAAIATNILWLSVIGEWGTAVSGAVNLLIAAVGMSVFMFQLYASRGQQSLLIYGIVFALFALYNLGFALWSRRFAIQDRRTAPRPVRISFWIFATVLLLVAIALLTRAPAIFPWPLNGDSSVLFGWIFLGASVSFAYAATRPRWHDSKGQLIGFLAYDVILIVPFLGHFADVTPDHLLSLIIYVIVLVYSGALAIYYLLINKETRNWAIEREAGA
ncbi:MAG TPA: hypothetical protein VKQ72_04430 [Aggregatilineales bacterium]|nr:hypothetical protein [Aggregatilineales bacterium]